MEAKSDVPISKCKYDVDRTMGELRLRDAKTGPRIVPLTASPTHQEIPK